jgi:PGF-CTERM protein
VKTNIKASIIGLVVVLVLIDAVYAVDATAVKVVPASQTVHAGETFSVNITIENVTDMKSDQARLYFEPRAKNAAVEIMEGNFLKTGGSTLPIEKIDNTEGFAGFAYTLLSGTPVTGSGVLATIKFNTSEEAGGTYDLYLTDVVINTTAGKVTVEVYNGTIKILAPAPTSTPTPTSTGDGASGGGGAPTDTDGDGLSDFDEKVKYKTDHKKADTDGGGVKDGTEVVRGTDPLDSTDDIVSTLTQPTLLVTPTVSPSVTPSPTPIPTPSPTPTSGLPGFEVIFAIAGLFAVAYLVMQRRKA